MCTFGVLGLSCETPPALGPPGRGVARQPKISKRAHFRPRRFKRARSTSANFDFGQLFFRVRPIRLRPFSTSAKCWMLNFGTPKGGEAPKGGAPKGEGPKISRFFSLLPPQFSLFSPSLEGPFVEFWWCLKRRGPEMCTFGVLGLSCEAPAAQRKPGKTDIPREDASEYTKRPLGPRLLGPRVSVAAFAAACAAFTADCVLLGALFLLLFVLLLLLLLLLSAAFAAAFCVADR